MIEKLDSIEKKFEDLTSKIADPAIIADNRTWQKLAKEHSDLMPVVEKYRELKRIAHNIEEDEQLLKTEKEQELRELAEEEI